MLASAHQVTGYRDQMSVGSHWATQVSLPGNLSIWMAAFQQVKQQHHLTGAGVGFEAGAGLFSALMDSRFCHKWDKKLLTSLNSSPEAIGFYFCASAGAGGQNKNQKVCVTFSPEVPYLWQQQGEDGPRAAVPQRGAAPAAP